MYVRIARFEGGALSDIDAEGLRLRNSLQAYRAGRPSGEEVPPELARLVSRIEMLVDRDSGSIALCVYCDTREQLREADRILNEMSPTSEGWGKRVSVELYQVAFDEAMRLRAVA